MLNMYWKSNHFPPNKKKLKLSQGLKLKLCSRVLQYLLGTSRFYATYWRRFIECRLLNYEEDLI